MSESVWNGVGQYVSDFVGGLIEPLVAISLGLAAILILASVLARPLSFLGELIVSFVVQLSCADDDYETRCEEKQRSAREQA